MIVVRARLEKDLISVPYILARPMSCGKLYKVFYRGHNFRFAYQRFIELGGEILTRLEGKVIDEIALSTLKLENKYVVVHRYGGKLYNKIYAGGDVDEASKEFYKDKQLRTMFKDGKELK